MEYFKDQVEIILLSINAEIKALKERMNFLLFDGKFLEVHETEIKIEVLKNIQERLQKPFDISEEKRRECSN